VCCRYECARVVFAPVAVQLLQYAAACAGISASSSPVSAAAVITELPQRSMQSLRASAALIASVANVAYTQQGKQALAAEWGGKEGGAVALVAPLLLFDPPGVALRGTQRVERGLGIKAVLSFLIVVTRTAEGASRALVNMSGHEKLAKPMKEDVFLCLCAGLQAIIHRPFFYFSLCNLRRRPPISRYPGAASLQEFLVRAGDAKKKNEDDGLMGCAKVCNNVSLCVCHLQQHSLSA
jgi:hypothetical protein